MKISEVSRRTGLQKRTIRFYQELGLVNPALEERNGRYYKEYNEADIERLRIVAGLRRARFSLEQIRMMLEEPKLIPDIYREYLRELRQVSAQLQTLLNLASGIEPESLTTAGELCEKLNPASERLDMPRVDTRPPRFGRLDGPEFAESCEVAAWHRAQYSQNTPEALPVLKASVNPALARYALFKGSLPPSFRDKRGWHIVPLLLLVIGIFFIVTLFITRCGMDSESKPYRMWYEGTMYYGDLEKSGLPKGFEDMQMLGQLKYRANINGDEPEELTTDIVCLPLKASLYTDSKQLYVVFRNPYGIDYYAVFSPY